VKITKSKKPVESITIKTRGAQDQLGMSLLSEWWKAHDEGKLSAELISTVNYLKTCQIYRIRQLAVDIRLYSGLSVYSYAGSNVSRMDRTKTLPEDRPSFNIIQSGTDTLVARIGQNEPSPRFLTDGADYKKRHLAQELNRFIGGELYQIDAYRKGNLILKDAIVMGTGCGKIYRGDDDKVCLDRVLITDLYCDDNDAINGDPQQLYQLKLVDRDKLLSRSDNNQKKMIIEATPQSYPDNSSDSGRTTSDQVLVVEAWKLPSGSDPEKPGYIPGRHVIATVSGVILDEEWNKNKFPFVFIKYSDPFLGYWGQGLATQLFGIQMSINRIMYTIAKAINLVGVPRIFIESHSKVTKAHNNNEIGVIIEYSGVKPSYETANCNSAELYQERDRLIQYGFQQCGISSMQATSEKPAGLNSGEAIRSYDDINSDRMATLAKKYDKFYVDLSYQIVDLAMEIAKETGTYETVYPNKDGTKQISLPQMGFLKDPFIIQCFTESSLPKTPAGRIQTVTEMVQAGMLTVREGRRLIKYPDLEQNERLDNAAEERILQILDRIVEDGKYTMPDPYLDLDLASQLTVQYINLYLAANLEEEKADDLRKFFQQIQALKAAGQPPVAAPAPPSPTAAPQPTPTSPLVPNTAAPSLAA
jgi:hypothetical protein